MNVVPDQWDVANKNVIAIDGPVASGKTTVGEMLSDRLVYRFLDTGMMYRGLAWQALQQGIDFSDEAALSALARDLNISPTCGSHKVIVNGSLLAEELRTPQVEIHTSRVAQVLSVRRAMVDQQRRIAGQGDIVIVGRDIGTVVSPDADLKVYLIASPQERARRRLLQTRNNGEPADYKQILLDLEERDKTDSQRTHSPLRAASDAWLVDTDGLDIEQVVQKVLALWGNMQ
jgi:cytidylate kinase